MVRRRTLTSALTEDASARQVRDDLPTLHDFESIEEARDEIDACIERYNRGWLLERHGYRTPDQVRQEFTQMEA